MTGTVHGSPTNQTLKADWVFNHQFLRVDEVSAENVSGTNEPYEGVFFIGYDSGKKRYLVHLMNVFGGTDSGTLGYGQRSGNNLKIEFRYPDGSVVQRFVWEPATKAWRLVSSASNAGIEGETLVDLRATRAK